MNKHCYRNISVHSTKFFSKTSQGNICCKQFMFAAATSCLQLWKIVYGLLSFCNNLLKINCTFKQNQNLTASKYRSYFTAWSSTLPFIDMQRFNVTVKNIIHANKCIQTLKNLNRWFAHANYFQFYYMKKLVCCI